MSEDNDGEADDELGQVADQAGGIANRFGEMSDTSETTESTEVSETIDTSTTQAGETTEMSESAETSETTESTETNEALEPGNDDFQLREHWNGRTLYLPDDVVDDLDLRYKKCSIKWQQQRGDELPKNERFYPAVIRAALRETSIEDELGLE